MADRSAKSNRAQGDVFELLLLREVVKALRGRGSSVKFAYGEQLPALTAAVVEAHGPAARGRLAQQERAAALAGPVVDELLERRSRRIGRVKALLWTGRETGLDVAATDLEAVHERGATRLSLKSTLSGTGTLKNFGGRSLATLLGVDVAALGRRMAACVEQVVPTERRAELAVLTRLERRQALTDAERDAAHAAAYPVLEELAAAVLASFATLPQERLARFVAYGLALPQGQDPDLFSVVVNASGSFLAPPSGLPTGPVTATRASSISAVVACDDVATFRVTVSCTNGIGLSPLCARTFQLPSAGAPVPLPEEPHLCDLLGRAAALASGLPAAAGRDELLAVLRRAQEQVPVDPPIPG